jgi:signal transduction histidine kinase
MNLGDAAAHLAWLSPCAGSLVALARQPASVAWESARTDPGAILLILRPSRTTTPPATLTSLARDPALFDLALQLLEAPAFVDWNQPAISRIYQAALARAALAQAIAIRSGRAHAECAWAVGLLTSLGWLAACAVDPAGAAACLGDDDHAHAACETQRRHWGLDQSAIARRLARHWQLPDWLAVPIGHLGLPAATAQRLGADLDLFHIAQLTVGLAERHGLRLGMSHGPVPEEAAATLGLSPEQVQALARETLVASQPTVARTWEAPLANPLLRDLLYLAADNRRCQDAPSLESLEDAVDLLHRGLEDQTANETERLRTLKLNALAELAAGAGHEINNPLAVISGQAQYLLQREVDPARQLALHKIVAQAQRIHEILTELMQFARPTRPQKQLLDVPSLIREVIGTLADMAVQRRVRLTSPELERSQPLSLYADSRHLRTAIAALLRNAIEAAPADGWASIRLETPTAERIELIVEDSGPGPAVREHLFDPFFSARPAGRGRGLGLPTAWRLAREHGGDIILDESAPATRFILRLPRETTTDIALPASDRQSA